MTGLALVGGLLFAPVAMSGCSKPVTPAFEVVLGIAPVSVASNISAKELAAMAARSHAPLRHPAYGFYISTFGYILKVTDREMGSGSCPHDIVVHVFMGLAARHIVIAQELKESPCLYSVYLQHYKKHAASDVAVIVDYRARVTRSLRQAKISVQASSSSPEDQIYRSVRDTNDRTLQPLTADRKAMSKEIDSSSEVDDLERGCGHGSGVGSLVPM